MNGPANFDAGRWLARSIDQGWDPKVIIEPDGQECISVKPPRPTGKTKPGEMGPLGVIGGDQDKLEAAMAELKRVGRVRDFRKGGRI